jgi:hypothetical protein
MEGQPWPVMGELDGEEREGEGEGERWARLGGVCQGGYRRGLGLGCSVVSPCS